MAGPCIVGWGGGGSLVPDPNPCAGKGLVTLERFLGCTFCTGTWLNRSVMQSITRQLYVAMQWNAKS